MIYLKFLDVLVWEYSVDLDRMQLNKISDQGLQSFNTSADIQMVAR